MTKTVYETDILEIKTVRIACECGYAILVPTDKTNSGASVCPCCNEKLPVGAEASLRKAIADMQYSIRTHFPKIRVTFETEPKKE